MPKPPGKLPEPFRKAARAARRSEWVITYTGSGHLKWKPPAGPFVFTPSSPSDHRGIRNSLSDLRAAGLEF